MNRASCLGLLSNAVLSGNTPDISKLVDHLRTLGKEVCVEDMARISPLAHRHVIPNGRYEFGSLTVPNGRDRS